MSKKIFGIALLLLGAVFIFTMAKAQLEKPGESSVQTMEYETADDQIVEKPVPDTLEEQEGFHYDVEDAGEMDPSENPDEQDQEAMKGQSCE